MSRSIAVLYGSESGNSQDFAYLVSRRLKYLRFETETCALDDFELKRLMEIQYLVIVCSTTGQGDVPRNAKSFWQFMLRKKLPADLLSHVKFSTFGIGDSSYPRFNYAIKKIHKRLLQLGAGELSPRAEGDEQSPEGVEGFYLEWEKSLVEQLNIVAPLKNAEELPQDYLLPPENRVSIDYTASGEVSDEKEASLSRNLQHARILTNERITSSDHFQDVRKLCFESEEKLDYLPGDTAALYPSNKGEDVEALILNQEWEPIADKPISMRGSVPFIEGGFVQPLTLRSLLTHHLDIMSIPRRSFFTFAYHFDRDPRESEKLKEFTLLEESDQLYDYCNRPRRSILEVILEFEYLKIPLEYVFDIFPLIKPRQFSISSKPSPNRIELTVAIVEYKTIIRRIRQGLCTSWIKRLDVGGNICFSVYKNNLRISSRGPIIMVGPGTGVAPMKSLIEHKVAQGLSQGLYLFFGNRYKDKDFLYREVWQSLKERQLLTVYTSFSREKGGYVQDKLYFHKEKINELLLHQNAQFYLCGSSGKMPIQVRMTLEAIFKECNNVDEAQAKQMLLDLENSGLYIQETW